MAEKKFLGNHNTFCPIADLKRNLKEVKLHHCDHNEWDMKGIEKNCAYCSTNQAQAGLFVEYHGWHSLGDNTKEVYNEWKRQLNNLCWTFTEVFCTLPCLKDHTKHFTLNLTFTKALLTSHHANTWTLKWWILRSWWAKVHWVHFFFFFRSL